MSRAIGKLEDVKQLVCGESHSCVLLGDATVKCWGSDNDGQLGNDTAKSSQSTPVSPLGLSDIVHISAGSDHTCAVHGDGAISCWGSNEYRQLGNGGGSDDQPTPDLVEGL